MFARPEPDSDGECSGGEEGEGGGEQPPAGTEEQLLPAPELNEDETIIAIGEQSCPKPLRLFKAWNNTMGTLCAEAAKFAQAQVQPKQLGRSDGRGVASRAVDGGLRTDFAARSCTLTASSWWPLWRSCTSTASSC